MRARPRLNWIHIVAGIVGLLAFLGTGQFMDRRLDHLVGMPDGLRVLYLSAHIYILFSGLLNLILGVYLVRSASRPGRVIQYFGSALLLSSLVFFLYGFFVETPLGLIERPKIRSGIVCSLLGVLLHGASALYFAPESQIPTSTGELRGVTKG